MYLEHDSQFYLPLDHNKLNQIPEYMYSNNFLVAFV